MNFFKNSEQGTYEQMNDTMAKRLTALRKQRGFSQEQLAEKLNVSRQAVSKWERAEAQPDISNLSALSKLYGITIDELINGKAEQEEVQPTLSSDVEESREDYSAAEEETADENTDPRIKLYVYIGIVVVVIVTIVYLVMGYCRNLWHPGWIIFFLIPVLNGLISSIINRRMKDFPYPVAVAAVYLVMGFGWNLWHPGWVVFLTIPMYYGLISVIGRR